MPAGFKLIIILHDPMKDNLARQQAAYVESHGVPMPRSMQAHALTQMFALQSLLFKDSEDESNARRESFTTRTTGTRSCRGRAPTPTSCAPRCWLSRDPRRMRTTSRRHLPPPPPPPSSIRKRSSAAFARRGTASSPPPPGGIVHGAGGHPGHAAGRVPATPFRLRLQRPLDAPCRASLCAPSEMFLV